MRVAIVVKRFPVLSETFIINHVCSLLQAGLDVHVFSFEKGNGDLLHPQYVKNGLDRITTYGVSVPVNKWSRLFKAAALMLKNARNGNFRSVRTLNPFRFGKQVLTLGLFYKAQLFGVDNRFDIIHCHYGPIGDDVCKLRAAGLVEGKVVVSFHGVDFLKKIVLKQFNNYANLFTSCEGVIANSSFTKSRLTALGCASHKITVIPVIPSLEIVGKATSLPAVKGKYRILTIARLEEVKGLTYAIQAIYLLRKKYDIALQYDVIGGGSLLSALQQQLKKLALEEVIFLHGPKSQNDIVQYFQQADVYLSPSLMETQGLVLLEAQLNKIPVVATRTGGVPDSVLENETGLLVEVKDIEGMAAALYRLYTDTALRLTFGEHAYSFVKENFDPEKLTADLLSFYKRL